MASTDLPRHLRAEVEHQDDHEYPEDPPNDGLARLEDVDDAVDGRVLGVILHDWYQTFDPADHAA